MSFTFKKQAKETGLRSVGNPYQCVDIKVKGKICGTISAPNWSSKDSLWHIRLMIFKDKPDSNPNWKWVELKRSFDSEQAARDFLKANYKQIVEKYNLRFDTE